MKAKALYIVQYKRGKRWLNTIWTGYIARGMSWVPSPVSLAAARKALRHARAVYPRIEYRIREYKPRGAKA